MSHKPVGFTEQLARRIKNMVDDAEKHSVQPPGANPARLLVGYTSPVEITSAWFSDGMLWKCRACRLWNINGEYRKIDEHGEFDLYHPTSQEQPAQGVGERVFAVYRGVWEMVSGAGGATTIRAVVMKSISQPSDTTARPPDGMGKIALFSKTYIPCDPDDCVCSQICTCCINNDNSQFIAPDCTCTSETCVCGQDQCTCICKACTCYYDDCVCLELAKTEKLLKGEQVQVEGPIYYANPAFNPNLPECIGNAPILHYYIAVETLGEYTAPLNSVLTASGTSTITVSSSGETADFEVVCTKLRSNERLLANDGVTVNRTLGNAGRVLEVMLGPCPERSN